VPHFDTEADARARAKSQQAILSAKRAHIEAKLNWRAQYYDFQELLELYRKWQQARAPNSWKSNLYYLEQWVFPYFLLEKKSNNVKTYNGFLTCLLDYHRLDPDSLRKASALHEHKLNRRSKSDVIYRDGELPKFRLVIGS
jgi:hypothetical protein